MERRRLVCFSWLLLLPCVTCSASHVGLFKPLPTNQNLTESERSRNAALSHFSVVLGGHDDEISPHSNVIYRNGNVGNMWRVWNRTEEETMSDKGRLFHHGPYTDRITFEISYSGGVETDFADPEVFALNDSVARPKVVEFAIDKSEQHAITTIAYDCRHQVNSSELHKTFVLVTIPVISGLEVQFALRKTCGGGKFNPNLDFGAILSSSIDGTNTERRPFPKTDSGGTPSFVEGPHRLSTRIYLELRRGVQEFFHVQATSSNSEEVDLAVRGPVFGGVLSGGQQSVLHIVYSCEHHGKSNISVQIAIPPFGPLVAHWIKDCGGGAAPGLYASTQNIERWTAANVVAEGVPLPEWSASSMLINATVPNLKINFWNQGPPVQFNQIAVTVEKPNIVYASVANMRDPFIGMKTTSMSPLGGLLATGTRQQLRLELVCKRLGSSRILLTLPLKSYNNVEIGFRKQCKTPKLRRHSGFMRTANSLLHFLVFTLTVISVLVVRFLRRSKGQSQAYLYAELPAGSIR